jgi:hypothetical protein
VFEKALITPRDVLAASGEDITLEVEVERFVAPFVDPALEGVEVEIDGIGVARTDAEGVARFTLGAVQPGARRYRARMKNGRWRAIDAEAHVSIVPRDAPILVTDVDGTIADVSSLAFPFRSNRGVPPLDGAVEALREISGRMTVVYLTARDHIFIPRTKAWLEMKGFPAGPLYARKVRLWSCSPREHKVNRLGELAARFTNIRWGVGDLPGDIAAYGAHGISPILVAARCCSGAQARTWNEILSVVQQDARPHPLR